MLGLVSPEDLGGETGESHPNYSVLLLVTLYKTGHPLLRPTKC